MYAQPAFVASPDEAWTMLADAGLGLLVTPGPDGLSASHLPFIIDRAGERLLGHLARANPHVEQPAGEALVAFQISSAYVSPNWYPSKHQHGRQVPTWNYEAVHVRGRLTWLHDPGRLRDIVERLTDRFEADQPTAWTVSDAPPDYIARLLNGIVGLEIAVTSIEGVRKLSQNKPEADRIGVTVGLADGDGGARTVAAAMARSG